MVFEKMEVTNYETYQKAVESIESRFFNLLLMLVGIVLIVVFLLYRNSKKTKKSTDKSNYVMSAVICSLFLGLIVSIFVNIQVYKLEKQILNTPNVVYKWEKEYVFSLDQVDIKVQKKIDTNVNLVVKSKINEPIEMDTVFEMNSDNTLFRDLSETEGERIVLEKRVLKDHRFKELTKERSLLSDYYPDEKTRWIFYVNEKNKELLQLQNISF
ncbi:hypothetical protein AB6889_17735 [Carnobacterium maltaromaticum]|uniref:hypothetical protein n=1 Tax=Carnobacterium maltaromaticum TaxID=2751 RepID=UPI0039BEAF9D